MNVPDKLNEQDVKLKELEAKLLEKEKKKLKGWKIKIPFKVSKKVLKDDKKAAALYVGPNGTMSWKTAVAKDGLWIIEEDKDDKGYAYEEQAIYHLKQKKKMIPVIIILSWRLLTVGGKAEEFHALAIGGMKTEEIAEKTGIKKFGQQTIIRAIEQAELDKGEKKKANFGWIIWVVLGLGALYLLSKFFIK